MSFQIAGMGLEHLEGVVALQRACFPEPFPEELLWQAHHLIRHLEAFPEGQLVAISDDRVIGSASSTRISEENWRLHGSWDETVGGPLLSSFEPEGTTLYGLDISVHPEYRSRGVGRRLYEARFNLIRSMGLVRYGTACRIPDFQGFLANHPGTSIGEYANNVVQGRTIDRTLTPLLRYGLTFLDVIHDYMDDFESGHGAALLEWKP